MLWDKSTESWNTYDKMTSFPKNVASFHQNHVFIVFILQNVASHCCFCHFFFISRFENPEQHRLCDSRRAQSPPGRNEAR